MINQVYLHEPFLQTKDDKTHPRLEDLPTETHGGAC
jgi:hypothetical protein